MIKFENKLYNICIPLGEECYTCESIDKKFNKNIRLCAFPFDYVGHTFIENIIDLNSIINDLCNNDNSPILNINSVYWKSISLKFSDSRHGLCIYYNIISRLRWQKYRSRLQRRL